jgi:hypothetical protein
LLKKRLKPGSAVHVIPAEYHHQERQDGSDPKIHGSISVEKEIQ